MSGRRHHEGPDGDLALVHNCHEADTGTERTSTPARTTCFVALLSALEVRKIQYCLGMRHSVLEQTPTV